METQMDKVSYIIGRQIGEDFKKQGLEISTDIFASGIQSALKGEESKLSSQEITETMNAFQAHMSAQLEKEALIQGEVGIKYLEENKVKEGVKTTPTGLQYKVLTSGDGSGKKPTINDSVEVNYEGKLIDGTIFDSSYARGQSISFPVSGVIAGWTEALQLMSEGDTWELTIPSILAYGSQGAGAQIPPHSTLVFKVELIAVK